VYYLLWKPGDLKQMNAEKGNPGGDRPEARYSILQETPALQRLT